MSFGISLPWPSPTNTLILLLNLCTSQGPGREHLVAQIG